ncbi:MAG TPA: hypothetical protein VN156_05750 [Pseudomonas sp.]|nr:hypothetical protein [Pseudomonas sp.]
MSLTSRALLHFLFAVLLATAVGTIAQTQFNLAAIQAIGAPIPLDVRLQTTALDLLGFSPTFGALVLVGFLFAIPAAAWSSRGLPALRWLVFALTGALTVLAALMLANALAPMPTLIGANRTLLGTLALMASGSAGALFYTWLRRPAAQS